MAPRKAVAADPEPPADGLPEPSHYVALADLMIGGDGGVPVAAYRKGDQVPTGHTLNAIIALGWGALVAHPDDPEVPLFPLVPDAPEPVDAGTATDAPAADPAGGAESDAAASAAGKDGD